MSDESAVGVVPCSGHLNVIPDRIEPIVGGPGGVMTAMERARAITDCSGCRLPLATCRHRYPANICCDVCDHALNEDLALLRQSGADHG